MLQCDACREALAAELMVQSAIGDWREFSALNADAPLCAAPADQLVVQSAPMKSFPLQQTLVSSPTDRTPTDRTRPRTRFWRVAQLSTAAALLLGVLSLSGIETAAPGSMKTAAVTITSGFARFLPDTFQAPAANSELAVRPASLPTSIALKQSPLPVTTLSETTLVAQTHADEFAFNGQVLARGAQSYFETKSPSLKILTAQPIKNLPSPVVAWNERLDQTHRGPYWETVGGVKVPVPTVDIEPWPMLEETVEPMKQNLSNVLAVICAPFDFSESTPQPEPDTLFPSNRSPIPGIEQLQDFTNSQVDQLYT